MDPIKGGDPRARTNGSRPSFEPALKRKIDINLDDRIKLEKKNMKKRIHINKYKINKKNQIKRRSDSMSCSISFAISTCFDLLDKNLRNKLLALSSMNFLHATNLCWEPYKRPLMRPKIFLNREQDRLDGRPLWRKGRRSQSWPVKSKTDDEIGDQTISAKKISLRIRV
ncbi:hypothetical protein BpHYR1_006079 [Brachionus plicatilis]|uniref:Uncharacterized protein n=1 Tax=Brachionus plicatilis TaxID=10195 RepID=A0A3M7RD84_BRAPC|nr:hypothetical protein BpHYR1_006079 [Brachionus plicatilis]